MNVFCPKGHEASIEREPMLSSPKTEQICTACTHINLIGTRTCEVCESELTLFEKPQAQSACDTKSDEAPVKGPPAAAAATPLKKKKKKKMRDPEEESLFTLMEAFWDCVSHSGPTPGNRGTAVMSAMGKASMLAHGIAAIDPERRINMTDDQIRSEGASVLGNLC